MDDDSGTRPRPSMADIQGARAATRTALAALHPRVTMERDGLVLVALDLVDRGARNAPRGEPPYLLFEQAAADGLVEIREIGAGTVPSVLAITQDRPVVVFAGDTIVGGKQNRVINVTVWLPAGKVTELPVTCLEFGRWDPGHAAPFRVGRKADYALRSMVSSQVSEQRRRVDPRVTAAAPAGRAYAADQGEVWAEIGRREVRAGRQSATSALHELYETEQHDARPLAAAFPRPDGATGLAVAVGGRLVALELFDHPATLAAAWPRLVEAAVSAHLDHQRAVAARIVPASDHRYPDAGALGRTVGRAVAALNSAPVGISIGEGFDLRPSGPKIAGSALVREGRVVHAEIFRVTS
ncbi:MAG TPA: DUF6569 family protein [Patescibacteria group bacterium]|nr:DUF6569 family protein [Patescibacteria group bacterium]